MAKTDQGPMFKLPKGTAEQVVPDGCTEVSDYGKTPIAQRFNPDRGQMWPRDPQRGLKKG